MSAVANVIHSDHGVRTITAELRCKKFASQLKTRRAVVTSSIA